MDTNKVLVGVIAILLVFSVIQTLQLNAMANDVKEQEGKITELEGGMQKLSGSNLADIKTTAKTGASSVTSQPAVQNLPQMVGGC